MFLAWRVSEIYVLMLHVDTETILCLLRIHGWFIKMFMSYLSSSRSRAEHLHIAHNKTVGIAAILLFRRSKQKTWDIQKYLNRKKTEFHRISLHLSGKERELAEIKKMPWER